jgi:hypothetical protein
VVAGQPPDLRVRQRRSGHAVGDVGVGPVARQPLGQPDGPLQQVRLLEYVGGLGQRPRDPRLPEVEARQDSVSRGAIRGRDIRS